MRTTSLDWFGRGEQRWFLAPFFKWSVGILATIAAGLLVFDMLGVSVFKLVGWAHSVCYLRDPKMIALHVVSDALIGIAYVAISSTLAYLVYKASKDIPFNSVFLAFGLFIVSCGFTHFMEVWVVWQPVYWLAGYVKVVTAAASVATAIALFPLVPRIFALIGDVKQTDKRRQEIEALNQELDRFNYSVAHDLRAPLRSVAGFASALLEDYPNRTLDATGVDYLQRIRGSAVRMDELLRDLLHYSRLSSEQLQLEPIPLHQAIDAAFSGLEADIRSHNAIVRRPATDAVVLGSRTLLNAVLQNLIGNALKFVAPGVVPEVIVTVEVAEGRAVIRIRDNGIGIAREHRDRVFRMFERLRTEFPGTGIGLAIVSRSLERLNGTIEIEDTPEQQGTVFRVTLPLARTLRQ